MTKTPSWPGLSRPSTSSFSTGEDESPYGFMEGSVLIPDGYDLTAPVLQESLDADTGTLHR